MSFYRLHFLRDNSFVLSLGALVFDEPTVAAQLLDKDCSIFRNGLRLWQSFLGDVLTCIMNLTQDIFVLFDPYSIKTVGP